MNSPQKIAAFTLIELLVVVSIIAILMAILLPTIAMVKSAAQTTACQSNQRQVGLAVFAYAGENEGLTPHSALAQGPGFIGNDIEYLYDNLGFDILLVNDFMTRDRGAAKVMFCPALPFRTGHHRYTNTAAGSGEAGLDLYDFIAENNYRGRYQMPGYVMRNKNCNGLLTGNTNFGEWSYKMSEVKATKTAFLTDRTVEGTYTGLAGGTNVPFLFKPIHRKGWNVWYLDGSVQFNNNTAFVGTPASGNSGNNGSTFLELDRK